MNIEHEYNKLEKYVIYNFKKAYRHNPINISSNVIIIVATTSGRN